MTNLPEGYTLHRFPSLESSNDEALSRAARGAPHGTLILAASQTRGRGRRGRSWHSPEGNLHLSMILRPECQNLPIHGMAFAAALAVRDLLATALPEASLGLKWPNDVLVSGRKISGLLIERPTGQGGALVLGVGINLVAHPDDTPYPATDVVHEGGCLDVDRAVAGFVRAFDRRYRALVESGFSALRQEWLAHAVGLGKGLRVEVEGARFDGLFHGLDPEGALLLDLGQGRMKTVTAGDVFFDGQQRIPSS